MTDEQIVKLAEALRPQVTAWQKVERVVTILGLGLSIGVYAGFQEVKDQLEMMKAYQSARQSKAAELIGTLRGQGDRRTADILEILQEQENREAEKITREKRESTGF